MILFKKKIENCHNTLGQVKEFLALQIEADKFIYRKQRILGLKEKNLF